jgi:hypothetical protein
MVARHNCRKSMRPRCTICRENSPQSRAREIIFFNSVSMDSKMDYGYHKIHKYHHFRFQDGRLLYNGGSLETKEII